MRWWNRGSKNKLLFPNKIGYNNFIKSLMFVTLMSGKEFLYRTKVLTVCYAKR